MMPSAVNAYELVADDYLWYACNSRESIRVVRYRTNSTPKGTNPDIMRVQPRIKLNISRLILY